MSGAMESVSQGSHKDAALVAEWLNVEFGDVGLSAIIEPYQVGDGWVVAIVGQIDGKPAVHAATAITVEEVVAIHESAGTAMVPKRAAAKFAVAVSITLDRMRDEGDPMLDAYAGIMANIIKSKILAGEGDGTVVLAYGGEERVLH